MAAKGFYLKKKGLVMGVVTFEEGAWQKPRIVSRHTTLRMDPAAVSLNYGLGVFEGMKAYRTPDGRVVLFRPRDNARRLIAGAKHQGMQAPSEEMFLGMVEEVVRRNASYIPLYGASRSRCGPISRRGSTSTVRRIPSWCMPLRSGTTSRRDSMGSVSYLPTG